MTKKQKEISGLLLIIFALVTMFSLATHEIGNHPAHYSYEEKISKPFGTVSIWISHWLFLGMGYVSVIIPLMAGIIGYIIFSNKKIKDYNRIFLYISLFGLWVSIFIACIGSLTSNESFYNHAGLAGLSVFKTLRDIIGKPGVCIFLIVSILIFLTNLFEVSIYQLFKNIGLFMSQCFSFIKKCYSYLFEKIKNFRKRPEIIDNEVNIEDFVEQELVIDENDEDSVKVDDDYEYHKEEETENITKDTSIENVLEDENLESIEIEPENEVLEGDLDAHQRENEKYFQYKLPKIEYLNNPVEIVKQSEEDLRDKGDRLMDALSSFGVKGELLKISPGPIISLFEIEPAEGVRVNKFTNLSDDLARVMKAQRVRIIAPIPGSKSVGIELPNENTSIVYLRNIVSSTKFIESKSKLTIALGKTTSGDAYIFDLCKMPHLLIAGATGAGKSVCINTIILSILYKSKPDEVKFILLDPKKIELSTYKSLVGYHLITAPNLDEYVMTTSENSVGILNSAINEMERRFQVFSDARVRNIEEYHNKNKNDINLENIPYVVVVIDELADLMMTSGRAIEEPITRLAQKARAVGIHLVVATQRPSVDVITGLIKSNFPSRISFLVSSKIDSRTILDQMGAEKLLGRGDMLFMLPGSSSLIRIHNAYVTLDEIEKIMKHILSQPKPNEIKLPEVQQKQKEFDIDFEDRDELLQDAAKLVIDHQQASVSMLQRKFRIGYSRAGRLIDELESLGIISGYSGSKAREVLVDISYLKEIFDE